MSSTFTRHLKYTHCESTILSRVRVRGSERARTRSRSEVGSRDRARAKSRDKEIQVGSPRTLGDETRVIYIENQIGGVIERRVIRENGI